MNLRKFSKLASVTLIASLGVLGAAKAQTVEEFYRSNTVTLIVSATPGGSADFFARQFAPFLAKHIPGQPNIVVTNLPGASGMVAGLQLQTVQPKDGTVIALLQRNNFYLPLVSDDAMAFDPREISWLGSLNKENYGVTVWHTAAVETAEDLFTTPLRIGATAFSNENRTLPAMMNDFLGTQFDIIPGYSGAEEISLAMERGEVEGRFLTLNNLTAGSEAQWIEDGQVSIVMQVGLERSPQFPDVPNISEFITDPETESLANFMIAPLTAGRPFAVPGGIPAERLDALRQAFDDAAEDPEFIEAMARLNSAVEPITGEDVESIIAGLYATPDDVIAKVKTLLTSE